MSQTRISTLVEIFPRSLFAEINFKSLPSVFLYLELSSQMKPPPKDTVGFHVSVDDVLCMQIVHSLSCLPGDVNQLEHLELGLLDVQVFIEAAALTPLGHNRQVVLRHVPHEEQDVHVPCFAQDSHLIPKGLELLWCGVDNL